MAIKPLVIPINDSMLIISKLNKHRGSATQTVPNIKLVVNNKKRRGCFTAYPMSQAFALPSKRISNASPRRDEYIKHATGWTNR